MGVVTVGLLGVLGAAAGKYLQVQIEKSNERARKKETEHEAAAEIFQNLSSAMDDQLYNLRQVYLALYYKVEDGILQKRWDWYREVLYEWNRRANINIAMTTQYFGPQMGKQFETDILAEFRVLKRQLENAYFHEQTINSVLFEKRVEQLQICIREYTGSMLEVIQKEEYGAYHPDFAKVSYGVLQSFGLG